MYGHNIVVREIMAIMLQFVAVLVRNWYCVKRDSTSGIIHNHMKMSRFSKSFKVIVLH